jgi:serine/threonine-protein kinase
MLRGEPVWSGGSAIQVAAARVYEDPPELSDLPSQLGEILGRCLARDREERYVSAIELEQALAALGSSPRLAAFDAGRRDEHERKVGVLPFTTIGASVDAAIVEGLAEDLGDVLGMSQGLRVRHGLRVAEGADPIELGRELGLDVIVTGSVRRRGDRLRVSARVVGVADGYQLWAQRFERGVSEALALNDEVADAVAEVLASGAPPDRRVAPSNPRAVELYLLARREMARHFMDTDRSSYTELLDEALALAPDDPLMLASWVYGSMQGRIFEPFRLEPKIEVALERAKQLAPNQPMTHMAEAVVANYGRDDRAGSVLPLRRALSLAPNQPDAHYLLGIAACEAGEAALGESHFRRGLWADPSLPWLRTALAILMSTLGRREVAEELLTERDDPGFSGPRVVVRSRLAMHWGQRTIELDHEPALGPSATLGRTMWEVATGRLDLEGMRAGFAEVRAHMAPGSRAERLIGQLETEAACALGEHDHAFAVLGEATHEGLLDLVWLDNLQILAPLRERPGYAGIRAQMSARAAEIRAALRAPL